MDVVRSVVKFKGVCQRVKILKPQVELISASIRIIYPISHRKMGKLFYKCKDSLHPPVQKGPKTIISWIFLPLFTSLTKSKSFW